MNFMNIKFTDWERQGAEKKYNELPNRAETDKESWITGYGAGLIVAQNFKADIQNSFFGLEGIKTESFDPMKIKAAEMEAQDRWENQRPHEPAKNGNWTAKDSLEKVRDFIVSDGTKGREKELIEIYRKGIDLAEKCMAEGKLRAEVKKEFVWLYFTGICEKRGIDVTDWEEKDVLDLVYKEQEAQQQNTQENEQSFDDALKTLRQNAIDGLKQGDKRAYDHYVSMQGFKKFTGQFEGLNKIK